MIVINTNKWSEDIAAGALAKARGLMAKARKLELKAASRSIPDCVSANRERERAWKLQEQADELFDAIERFLDPMPDENFEEEEGA